MGFTTFAAYGSFVPLAWRPLAVSEAVERFRGLAWKISFESRTDWATNVLLFVPIGFCWSGAVGCDRQRWPRSIAAAPLVIALSAAWSVSIEFAQLWLPPRVPSPNDMAAESIGATLGVALWLACGQAATEWFRSLGGSDRASSRIARLAAIYVAGFVLYSWMPFDLTIRPAEIYHKYREGRICLVPFAQFRFDCADCVSLATDALLYVPVGMAAATTLTDRGRTVRSMRWSVLWGLLIACGIEAGQLFVLSRHTDATQLICAAAGIAVGGAVSRLWLGGPAPSSDIGYMPGRRGRWLWTIVAAGYAAFLMSFFWMPFHWISDTRLIESRWSTFFEAPFSSLFWGTELHAATQVVRKVLLFGLLGAMLQANAARLSSTPIACRRLLSALLALAAALEVGIEVGQIWLAGTTASFSDSLLYIAGTIAGAYIAERLSRSSA